MLRSKVRAELKAASVQTAAGALYALYRTLRNNGLKRYQALAVIVTTDVEFTENPCGPDYGGTPKVRVTRHDPEGKEI